MSIEPIALAGFAKPSCRDEENRRRAHFVDRCFASDLARGRGRVNEESVCEHVDIPPS